MTETRIAQLLRAHGVGETMSIRQAAQKVGVSRETLSRIMRPIEVGETRRLKKDNLKRISEGLGIPIDLLERAMMADWGYGQAVDDSTIADVLKQLQGFSSADLAKLQVEIGQIQQVRARPSAGSVANGANEDTN